MPLPEIDSDVPPQPDPDPLPPTAVQTAALLIENDCEKPYVELPLDDSVSVALRFCVSPVLSLVFAAIVPLPDEEL